MSILHRKEDWLILKSTISHNNPVLVRKDSITCIIPKHDNQLQSVISFKNETDTLNVDEPTSTIEGKL